MTEQLKGSGAGLMKWLPAVFGILLFLCASFGVYMFSPYTQVQALICQGNYYYSPQQIYSIAGVNVHSRTFANSISEIERKLEENPLIASASVHKEGQNLIIDVQEKNIIGYYDKEGTNYLVSDQDEQIPVENETEIRTLVHFPLMVDLSNDTISKIAEQVRRHPEDLNRQVFEKIAEIVPWSESYDKNMLKLVLQDGNTVFTSIPSLFMMVTYPRVLTSLQGQNVCLMLDGDNLVVEKKACEYMYLSPEQRAGSREIPKKILTGLYPTAGQDSSEEKKEENSESSQENPDSNTQPQEQNQPAAQPEQPQPEQPQTPPDPATVTDWEACLAPSMQYSPSAGVFRSVTDGTFYTYDQATDTFYPLQ